MFGAVVAQETHSSLASDKLQSGSMKTVSSDKSRKAVKADSVMKAQAWVSGIGTLNTATRVSGIGTSNSVDYTGETHPFPQSQLTTSLHPDDAQLTKPGSCPVVRPVMPSLMQPSVAKLKTQALTAASSLPPALSPSDTMVERTVVKNILNAPHLPTPWTDSTSNAIIFGTPMKRVDGISASTGHSAIDAHSASSRMLHYESNNRNGTRRNDYVPNDQYTKQFDSNFGLLPQVQSIVEQQGNEASKPHDTSQTRFKNMQQQVADVVSVHHSLHSNNAVNRENVDTEIPSTVTVSSQSSVVQHAITASLPVSAGHVPSSQSASDGLFPSHKNTRLNELWYRFSQDHTVCSSHATDSGTTLNISSVERTERDVMDSNTQKSKYQHPEQSTVKPAAGEKSQYLKTASDKLATSHSLGYSSSAVGFVNDVHPGYHNLSSNSGRAPLHNAEQLHSDSGRVPLRNTKSLHSSHEAHVNTENKTKDDAVKVSSLSANIPVKHAWIVRDETLAVVPEDVTLDSVTSDFASTSSVDDMGNVITRTTKRHLPDDSKLLRLQQKIAQQREKHRKVRRNEQRRKEHIVKMEMALHERQKTIEQKTEDVKRTADDRHPSSNQLKMTTSSTTLTTVTSNDSDLTLCSSSLQSEDRHLTNDSQLLSSFDTSGSCPCRQAECGIQRVSNRKAEDVFLEKRHKSETTFKPKLREVKYMRSKVTKSEPTVTVPTRDTSSRKQEKNASMKNVKRKVVSSSTSHRTHIPQTSVLKSAHDDRRSVSKTNKSTAKAEASLSKTNYTGRILTSKNQQFAAEHDMQSKAVQTTPRLKDNRVLYASTAVQCPAISSHFDELGIISLPVDSRGHRVRSLSSKIFSPDLSGDAQLLQQLTYKSLMKLPVRASVPGKLLKLIFSYIFIYLVDLCLPVSDVASRQHLRSASR